MKSTSIVTYDALTGGVPVLTAAPVDPLQQRWQRLQLAKEQIAELLHKDKQTKFAIVQVISNIADAELYRAASRADGTPFTSMDEYFPYLIDELAVSGQIDGFEKRTFYSYQAMYRVFVQGGMATVDEIVEIGPGHFSRLLAAADYDRKTGELAEQPRDKKLGKARIEELVEELRESHAEGVELRVVDTRTLVDEERGVTQRDVRMEWRPVAGGRYKLVAFTATLDYQHYDVLAGGVPAEQARKLARKIGAISKGLPEEE